MDESPRRGMGSAFGTCGELLQGVMAENNLDFLVTLPIRAGSTAVFEPDPRLDCVHVHPPHKTKSRRLAELVLRRRGIPGGGRLHLCCELPEGKGLASSSADLVATARAVIGATGHDADPLEIESYLRAIEPSDGVMYPGVVAFYHRQVRLHTWLGLPPPLTIVTADEGGAIDTITFNRAPKPFTAADKNEYSSLLQTLTAALAEQDTAAIGYVATRSAIMNSALRPRGHLDTTIAEARSIGALGVVVAHSGTTIGMLLADTDPDYPRKLADATAWSRSFSSTNTVHRSWRPGVAALL